MGLCKADAGPKQGQYRDSTGPMPMQGRHRADGGPMQVKYRFRATTRRPITHGLRDQGVGAASICHAVLIRVDACAITNMP